MNRLENGISLLDKTTGRLEPFIGSIYAILGDHIGQVKLMGVTQPAGKYPSRFTIAESEELGNLSIQHTKRDATKDALLINGCSKITNQAEIKRRMKSIKLHENAVKCPLWQLKAFSKSFYNRFGICNLHLGPLGNFKRHLKYLAAKYDRVIDRKQFV